MTYTFRAIKAFPPIWLTPFVLKPRFIKAAVVTSKSSIGRTPKLLIPTQVVKFVTVVVLQLPMSIRISIPERETITPRTLAGRFIPTTWIVTPPRMCILPVTMWQLLLICTRKCRESI